MKKRLIDHVLCRGSQIQYYLTSETAPDGTELYGILVEYGDESCSVPGITPSRSKIQRLLTLLTQGSVTPCTARDVIDDWLLQA